MAWASAHAVVACPHARPWAGPPGDNSWILPSTSVLMPGTNAPATALETRIQPEPDDHRQCDRCGLGAESQPQRRAKSNPIRQLPGQYRPEHRGYSEYDPIGGARFETLTEAASNIIDQKQHVRDESDRVEPVLGKQRQHR